MTLRTLLPLAAAVAVMAAPVYAAPAKEKPVAAKHMKKMKKTKTTTTTTATPSN